MYIFKAIPSPFPPPPLDEGISSRFSFANLAFRRQM